MKTYTVKAGDSLWKICHRLGLNIEQIAQLNHFTKQSRHHLTIGQKLLIEGDNTAGDADSKLTLQLLDLASQPIKHPVLKVKHDGKEQKVKGSSDGLVAGLNITDISKGVEIFFKDISGKFVSIYKDELVPLGEQFMTLQARTIKIKGSLTAKEGAQQQSQASIKSEIRQKHTLQPSKRSKGKDKLPPAMPQVDTEPYQKNVRLEGGKPVHVIAPIFTSGNLRLAPINEKYRKCIIETAKKYGLSPQALAAFMQVEAAKSRKGEWLENGKADSSSAVGLMQCLPSMWKDVSCDKQSKLYECIKKTKPAPSWDVVLDWRTNAELSIDAAACYIQINLRTLKKQYGLPVDSLNDVEKVKLAYLAHHEGAAGANSVINNLIKEEKSGAIFAIQLGHKNGQVLANAYSKKFGGKYQPAYRYWLAYDLVDTRLRPEHFMVDPSSYQTVRMADVFTKLGGPAVQMPQGKSAPAQKQPSLPKSPQPTEQPGTPPTPQPASTVEQWVDPLPHCTIRTARLASKRSATFGMVRKDKDGKPRAHQGIDLQANVGTPLRAIANARVVIVVDQDKKPGKNYGKCVVLEVDLNDLPAEKRDYCKSKVGSRATVYFFYAHMEAVTIEKPTKSKQVFVNAGDIIGTTGCSGNAVGMTTITTGGHLHFEARKEIGPGLGLTGRFDPLPLIDNCNNR